MIMINRLIHRAKQAGTRQRQRDHLTSVIYGPHTTYRSELIDAVSRTSRHC
jgi:hypothetical protein